MSEVATAPAEATCSECGFALSDPQHIKGRDLNGRGLHGHIRTSKREADEQRADAFARAEEEGKAAHRAWLEGNAAELAALNASEAPPEPPKTPKGKGD